MPADIPKIPFEAVRYKKRAIEDEAWIKSFLHQAAYISIAIPCEGEAYIVTRNFVYDERQQSIYFHGALQGRTFELLAHRPRVCLTAVEMGRLLPAPQAKNFGVEYRSVVVFGHAYRIENSQDAAQVLQMLLDKYFPHLSPGVDYLPLAKEDIEKTGVFRVEIESWSGKQHVLPKEAPGAFYFGRHP